MELRDLRGFVAAGRELHFARAAAQLYMSPSAMSDLIRRLEQEMGTPLFARTTRRIALTEAGTELLGRAEVILELTAQAAEAVAAIGRGQAGAIRLGVTPPAAPVLAPHLTGRFMLDTPDSSVEIQRMWLPALIAALQAGTIDLALTVGDPGARNSAMTTVEVGAEPLLVGLRPDHPLAASTCVDLSQAATMTLGLHPPHLFPAWYASQRLVLADADVHPPIVELNDTDLSARHWDRQPEVEWVLLIGSLLASQESTVTRPVPGVTIPFTLSWRSEPAPRAIVQRFVDSARSCALPAGWVRTSLRPTRSAPRPRTVEG